MLTSIVDKIPAEVPVTEHQYNWTLLDSQTFSSCQFNSEITKVNDIINDNEVIDDAITPQINPDASKGIDMLSYLKWLPSILDSSRLIIANTIGRVVQMISSISTAFPKVVKKNIKHYILSMPLKWSSFSFLLPSSMLAPKLAVHNIIQMLKLVTDSIAMLVSIESTVIEYIEQYCPSKLDLLINQHSTENTESSNSEIIY